MTLLVKMKDGCYEYPVSQPKRIGDEFTEFDCRLSLAAQMAEIGLEPPMKRGVVYGYIENRHEAFVHPYYGWALPR